MKESGFNESFKDFMCTTSEGDRSVIVYLCVIFVWFGDRDDVRVKPCGWVSMLCKDCVEGAEKGLLCGGAKVFEEVVVYVVGSGAGGSGALDGEL